MWNNQLGNYMASNLLSYCQHTALPGQELNLAFGRGIPLMVFQLYVDIGFSLESIMMVFYPAARLDLKYSC